MKILLISISAPPKNSPESVQVGRYLKHLVRSHEVTLLTTEVTGGWEPADASMEHYLNGVKSVIRMPVLHPKIIAGFKRFMPGILVPDEARFFLWQFRRADQQLNVKPDVIVSRSAPFSAALMAQKFAEKYQVPWVMHFSDPWADNPFHHFSARIHRKIQHMEKSCITRADCVTFTSEKTVTFYKEKYPELSSRFRFLPNVFDENYVNNKPLQFGDRARFVFTGRLYGNRTAHHLIDAIEEATRRDSSLADHAEFLFAGFFDDASRDRIANAGTHVKNVGPLSLQESIELQYSATVLVMIDSFSEDIMFNLFFPSKLLDYLAARRPILALTGRDSTTFDVVEGKFGRCFHPEILDQLPEYILSIVQHYRAKDHEFFMLKSSFNQYSAAENAHVMNDIIREVCSRSK